MLSLIDVYCLQSTQHQTLKLQAEKKRLFTNFIKHGGNKQVKYTETVLKAESKNSYLYGISIPVTDIKFT